MTSESVPVWRVRVDDVPSLVGAILDPGRRHSLTIVSPASDTDQPRICVDELVDKVARLPTDVVVLDSMTASTALSDSISTAFHCYGGSVRVVMPNARVTDHFRRHPLLLIYPEDDRQLSLRRVVDAVERTPTVIPHAPAAPDVATIRPPSPGGWQVPKPGPRPAPPSAAQPAEAAPVTLPSVTPPPATSPSPAPETSGDAGVPLHTVFGLSDIEAVVSRAVARTLEEQLGGPSSATEHERSRADTAEEQLEAANSRIARLEAEVRTLHAVSAAAAGELPQVFSDAEQQLRWEVDQVWLTGIPEPQRHERPIATSWSVGPAFLAGLDDPVVPRRKVLGVVMAILRGDGWTEYTTHQFLESKAGKPRTSPTGTAVWRTYVKQSTPQAPRLTWWQNPDGSFHFDHVGAHDDLI